MLIIFQYRQCISQLGKICKSSFIVLFYLWQDETLSFANDSVRQSINSEILDTSGFPEITRGILALTVRVINARYFIINFCFRILSNLTTIKFPSILHCFNFRIKIPYMNIDFHHLFGLCNKCLFHNTLLNNLRRNQTDICSTIFFHL